MRSPRSESFEGHLSTAILIAGYYPIHRHLMEGHLWPALQTLVVSCVAALMTAYSIKWIRTFQSDRDPRARTRRDDPRPRKDTCNLHVPPDGGPLM